ncbi:MAG: HAD family hydrolase [Eubacterium sp.]
MYNTVIFDLDGTLLNTLEDLADAVNFVLKKFGWQEHTIDQVRSHVGNGIRNLMKRSVPDGFANPQFEDAFETFKEYYQAHCQVKTDAYPGIMELLKVLYDKGYKMAIVSNKAHKAVVELNEIYFKDYIQVAMGENEDAGIKKKPAPEMVYKALERLGSSKEEAIYVGDSDVDKATADNAGMECVLCQWGFRELELLQSLKPKAIIAEPMELIEIISD